MPTQHTAPLLTRPGTLAEAVRLAASATDAFRLCLVGFLDEFYADTDKVSRYQRIAEPPDFVNDEKTDALIGAIGEHLCYRWMLGEPPKWTRHKNRFLHRPWFMGPERMKPFLLAESPSAFRRRFIFTEAEPLRRASMPRDGRWWYYERIRSGLTPQPEDIATAS